MDSDESDHKKSATGPSELTDEVDFIKRYGLSAHYDFFCKRPLPESISDTDYLHDVLGDTEIRKGEGMELGQLVQSTHLLRETNTQIQPFDLDILKEAFHLMEADPVDLPSSEKGTPTIAGKSKGESKDKGKTYEKSMDRERDKHKEHKKHHWHRHRSKDNKKEKRKEKSGYDDSGSHNSRRYHEKKRKHNEDDDSYAHSET